MLQIFPSILLYHELSGQHPLKISLQESGSPQLDSHIQLKDEGYLSENALLYSPKDCYSFYSFRIMSISFLHTCCLNTIPLTIVENEAYSSFMLVKEHGSICIKFQKFLWRWSPANFLLFTTMHFITIFIKKESG